MKSQICKDKDKLCLAISGTEKIKSIATKLAPPYWWVESVIIEYFHTVTSTEIQRMNVSGKKLFENILNIKNGMQQYYG